jgi:hypothetical protein
MIVQNHCIILQDIDGYRRSERRGHMESFRPQQVAYEAQRAQVNRQELVARIVRAMRDDRRVEPLKGLYLNRISSPTGPVYGVSEPSFCVIAQGSNVGFGGKNEEKEHELHVPTVNLHLPSARCREREYVLTFSNAHYRS